MNEYNDCWGGSITLSICENIYNILNTKVKEVIELKAESKSWTLQIVLKYIVVISGAMRIWEHNFTRSVFTLMSLLHCRTDTLTKTLLILRFLKFTQAVCAPISFLYYALFPYFNSVFQFSASKSAKSIWGLIYTWHLV